MGNSGTWSHNGSLDSCWSAAVATRVKMVDWIWVGVLLEMGSVQEEHWMGYSVYWSENG